MIMLKIMLASILYISIVHTQICIIVGNFILKINVTHNMCWRCDENALPMYDDNLFDFAM